MTGCSKTKAGAKCISHTSVVKLRNLAAKAEKYYCQARPDVVLKAIRRPAQPGRQQQRRQRSARRELCYRGSTGM